MISHLDECFALMYVGAPPLRLVSEVVRRRCWLPGTGIMDAVDHPSGCWDPNLGPLEMQPIGNLNHRALPPPVLHLVWTFSYRWDRKVGFVLDRRTISVLAIVTAEEVVGARQSVSCFPCLWIATKPCFMSLCVILRAGPDAWAVQGTQFQWDDC